METMSGREIGLSLISHIGTPRSHSARVVKSWHTHQAFELFFVLDGATTWEVRGRDPIEVTGSHLLIVPPGVTHRAIYAMRQPSDLCGLRINCRSKGKNSTFTTQDLRRLEAMLRAAALTVIPCRGELISRVKRFVVMKRAYESDTRNPALKASLRTLLCMILMEMTWELQSDPAKTPTSLVTAATDFLHQNIREQISVADLAKHMGFSRSYLFSIFKRVTGLTPLDYFLRIRIKRAEELLANSDQSITLIALDVGFSSSQYFSSVFRKHSGQTPSEYRQNHRKAGKV